MTHSNLRRAFSLVAIAAVAAAVLSNLGATARPTATVDDWFPPNPYPSGQSADDVPLPFEIPCESPKRRDKFCADKFRNAYKAGMVALNDFSSGQYNALTGAFDDLMDHLGEETQLCLGNAQGNYAQEQACWNANQAASSAAYSGYDTQILALSINHFNASAQLRSALTAGLESCCYYVTPVR